MLNNSTLIARVVVALALAAVSPLSANESLWEKRAAQEERWRELGLTLIPHQGNYFLPLTYNSSPHPSSRNDEQYVEAKFQLSLKVLLFDEIVQSNAHLYFGYTQLSLWQVYDRERSAPFRDTNHEPELILTFDTEEPLGTVTLRQIDVGVVHQSNGVGRPDSRSWNRVYGRFVFDRAKWALEVKPWIRLPDPERDENKDILRYMGHGEFTLSHLHGHHVFSVMLRNNMKPHDNKGAVRVEYSFLFTRRITGLLQYFNGYGESLLDYNRPNNRISIGLALGEWR